MYSGGVSIIDSNGNYLKKNVSAINTYIDTDYIRFLFDSNNIAYTYARKAGKYIVMYYNSSTKVNVTIIDVPASATLPYLLTQESTPVVVALG